MLGLSLTGPRSYVSSAARSQTATMSWSGSGTLSGSGTIMGPGSASTLPAGEGLLGLKRNDTIKRGKEGVSTRSGSGSGTVGGQAPQ
jgi:succinyl-CoA synthetase alpha subunit